MEMQNNMVAAAGAVAVVAAGAYVAGKTIVATASLAGVIVTSPVVFYGAATVLAVGAVSAIVQEVKA
jgi:hypothetical protein